MANIMTTGWWVAIDGDQGLFYFQAHEFSVTEETAARMNESGRFSREVREAYRHCAGGRVDEVTLLQGTGVLLDDGGTGTAEWSVFTTRKEALAYLREEGVRQ